MRKFNVRYRGFSMVVEADRFYVKTIGELIFFADGKPVAYFSQVESVSVVPNV